MNAAEQEPVLVMLARMEGKLDLVGQRVADIVPRVERHETEISELKLAVQSLDEGAIARDKATLATAAALRDAKEAQEAQQRSDQARSDQVTIPWARLMGALALIVAIAGTAYGMTH